MVRLERSGPVHSDGNHCRIFPNGAGCMRFSVIAYCFAVIPAILGNFPPFLAASASLRGTPSPSGSKALCGTISPLHARLILFSGQPEMISGQHLSR